MICLITVIYQTMSLTVLYTKIYIINRLTRIPKIVNHCDIKHVMTLPIKTITPVLKISTYIITSIAASPTGRAMILVIKYVEIFKTGVIVFVGDITLTDNFQYQSQFLHMRVTNWPNIFVDQSQFSDPDFISGTQQRENVQFANNSCSHSLSFI